MIGRDWFVDRLDDVGDALADIRDWADDHLAEIWLFITLTVFFAVMGALVLTYPQHQEQQIQQCVRLFERTREQCAFMVRNHVAP